MVDSPAPRSVNEQSAAQVLIHFYRGELGRSDNWRTRLDTTTNWAVGTTAALLSISFTGNAPPVVFLFAGGLLLVFLSIEARRYRYYQVSIARVRAMEQAFIAPVIGRVPVGEPMLEALTRDLGAPRIRITQGDALAVRLWRGYVWLFAVLYLAWLARLWTSPTPLRHLGEVPERLRVGPVPGVGVLALAVALACWLVVKAIRGRQLAQREGGGIRDSALA